MAAAKRLFEVEVSGHCYVWAEDDREAEKIARRKFDEDMMDFVPIDCEGIPNDRLIPFDNWDDHAPLGMTGEKKTVKQLMDEIRARREEAKKEKAAKEYNEKFQVKLTDLMEAKKP